jgi:hypothetical protein
MPIPRDYQTLVYELLEKTREGKVRWRQTSYGTFSVIVGGTEFQIWAGEDEETGRDFVAFQLKDPKPGTGPSTLDTWHVDLGENEYDPMYELFGGARRHALGIPERLKALENALKTGEVIGEDGPTRKKE